MTLIRDFAQNIKSGGSLEISGNVFGETLKGSTDYNIATGAFPQIQAADASSSLKLILNAEAVIGANGGAMIQATETSVSNDRDLRLQPYGGKTTVGATYDAAVSETFTVVGTSSFAGNVGIGTSSTSVPLTTSIAAGSAGSLNNQISMTHSGASNSYHIKTIRATANDEPVGLAFVENTTERLTLSTSSAVFNEDGVDTDFRVESDTNSHMLFVDAGNDKVVMGSSGVPVVNGSSARVYDAVVDNGIAIGNSPFTHGFIGTGGTDGNVEIVANSYPANLGSERVVDIKGASASGGGPYSIGKFSADSGAIFNDGAVDMDFRVESSNEANMLFVDGGADQVGISATSIPPGFALGVEGSTELGNRENNIIGGGHVTEISGQSITDGTNYYGSYGSIRLHANSTYTASARQMMLTNGYKSNKFALLIGNSAATDTPVLDENGGGSSTSFTAVTFDAGTGAATFNEESKDADFRVESGSQTHMLFVDAGNNRIGIQTSAPDAEVHISGTSPHIDLGPQGSNRAKLGYASTNLYLGTTSGGGEVIIKNNIGSTDAPESSGDEIARFGDTVTINESGRDQDFRVESDTNSHRLFLDAGTDRIGMGTANPGSSLHVVSGNGTVHSFLGYFGRETANSTTDILTVSDQAFNSGTAIYARLVATSAIANESAIIEFWASLSRVSGGANTATAVTPVVAKAIAGTAISAGTLAWSGTTLQYTSSTTINYVGYSMELQVTNRDGATITVLP